MTEPTKLQYTLTNDILFKLMFTRHLRFLKRLVALLLGIQPKNIQKFWVTNVEILPERIGDKFCRLDINMVVDGRRVNIELQVSRKRGHIERILYYWARQFSALEAGGKYESLPRTIVISIVAFDMFDCGDFVTEHQILDVKRHTTLTDKLTLVFCELGKLPKELDAGDELLLWLKLIAAKTEGDLAEIEALGVPIMKDAIETYRRMSASERLRELERLREKARHDEAQALSDERRKGERSERKKQRKAQQKEREKWQGVVADKDAEIARLKARLGELGEGY